MDFSSALDTKIEDIERPPLLPQGTYRWMVTKHPEIDTIADGRFDVCDYTLKCLGAQDDVDAEDLSKFGSLENVTRRFRFMFNKQDDQAFQKTEFYHKQFLTEHLGIKAKKGASIKTLMAEAQNCVCLGLVTWRADKTNPEVQYDEIKRTAPVS